MTEAPGDRRMTRWAHFSHDADIGVVGIGPTKAEAFRKVAKLLPLVCVKG